MNALASETGLQVMALTAIVISLFGVGAGLLGVGRALRRVRRYNTSGSRKSYAYKQTYFAFARFVKVVLFLATGAVLAFVPDGDVRSAIARLFVIAILLILVSIMLVDEPWDARIDGLREKEAAERKRKESKR